MEQSLLDDESKINNFFNVQLDPQSYPKGQEQIDPGSISKV